MQRRRKHWWLSTVGGISHTYHNRKESNNIRSTEAGNVYRYKSEKENDFKVDRNISGLYACKDIHITGELVDNTTDYPEEECCDCNSDRSNEEDTDVTKACLPYNSDPRTMVTCSPVLT